MPLPTNDLVWVNKNPTILNDVLKKLEVLAESNPLDSAVGIPTTRQCTKSLIECYLTEGSEYLCSA